MDDWQAYDQSNRRGNATAGGPPTSWPASAAATSPFQAVPPSQYAAPPPFGQQPFTQQPPAQQAFTQQPHSPQPYSQQPTPSFSTGFPAGGMGPAPQKSGLSGLQIALIIVGSLVAAGLVFGIVVARTISDVAESGGFGELEQGFAYGDNVELDALWDGCAAGAYGDCDALYFRSEFDSQYERFGDSCGERNDPAGLCTDLYG